MVVRDEGLSMSRAFLWMTSVVLLCVIPGCAQSNAGSKSKFETQIESFEGVAFNHKDGACLRLDDGETVICVSGLGDGITSWPFEENGKRIRVEGYRIRGNENEPNSVYIRCVDRKQIGIELKEKQSGKSNLKR